MCLLSKRSLPGQLGLAQGINMSVKTGFHLWNIFDPKIRILHFTWFAFFLSFVIWFSHAPLLVFIKSSLQLDDSQIKALLILNIALTIPARIFIGILVDKFGCRLIFSLLLVSGGSCCIAFACSQTFEQLAILRFLLGFIGAGFVIGIRLVGEWFPASQIGFAEGIYGGWGNFGAAAAAMLLPALTLYFGGESGWRYALASLGCFTFMYAFIFYYFVRNTPDREKFYTAKKGGALEVSSWSDLWLLLIMNIPLYLALVALSWKLSPAGVNLLSDYQVFAIWVILSVLFFIQTRHIFLINKNRLDTGIASWDKYSFKQVSILNVSYFITFGSELAVVSMLPLFFIDTFTQLDPATASFLAGGFAFMNIIARPAGGWLSDKFGRRITLILLMCGLAIGYLVLSRIDKHWAIPAVLTAIMCCSFFVQAGCGAVFAIVPLIKRRMTGQIAGMTGAYGNVGGVMYLTLLSYVNYSNFFLVIGSTALAGLILCLFVKEQVKPAEFDHSGTVLDAE